MHLALRLALPLLPLGDLHALSRVCRGWRGGVRQHVSLPDLCRQQLGLAVSAEASLGGWDGLYRQLAAAGCFVLQRRRQNFRSKRAVVYHKVRRRWKVSSFLPHRNMLVCVRKSSGRVDLRSAKSWKRNVHGVVWHLTS